MRRPRSASTDSPEAVSRQEPLSMWGTATAPRAVPTAGGHPAGPSGEALFRGFPGGQVARRHRPGVVGADRSDHDETVTFGGDMQGVADHGEGPVDPVDIVVPAVPAQQPPAAGG